MAITMELPSPQAAPARARPKVSIHLPIRDEPPSLVRRTLDALARLDYPDFDVLVIDSNTACPALWEPIAEHCARLGPRFRFFHLGAWAGGKAGALNFALRETVPRAAVIGVVDSGCIVRRGWLRAAVPLFADPAVGIVQSPRATGRSPALPEAGSPEAPRDGAMTLVRRDAIERAGGWATGHAAETAELGLRLARQGWQAGFVAESFGAGPPRGGFAACRALRARQVQGLTQAAWAHAGALLSPLNHELAPAQRWTFLGGVLPWLREALGLLILVVTLIWSAALVLAPARTSFPPPALLAGWLLLCAWSRVQLAAPCRPHGLAELASHVAAGLAFSHAAGRAVLSGLFAHSLAAVEQTAPAAATGAHRLAAVRDEALLLSLSLAAAAGVGLSRGLDSLAAQLWCAMLLAQSLPSLAAVVAAMRSGVERRPAGPRTGALTRGGGMNRLA